MRSNDDDDDDDDNNNNNGDNNNNNNNNNKLYLTRVSYLTSTESTIWPPSKKQMYPIRIHDLGKQNYTHAKKAFMLLPQNLIETTVNRIGLLGLFLISYKQPEE